jgi:protein TonB
MSTMSSFFNRFCSHFPARSFALAILIELALGATAVFVLAGTVPAKPPLSEEVKLTLTEAPPEPEPTPVPKPPTPVPTPPKPQVKLKAAPPKPQPPTPAPPQPVQQPDPLPKTETPTAFTEPARPSTPPPPPPPPNTSGKTDRNAEYAAKVRAAVQAATVYPPAASSLRFSGRVRVEFHLRDAVAGQAKVLVPSGIGMIDRAALQSVQNARYPEPPANLQGSDLVYQVWVDFVP